MGLSVIDERATGRSTCLLCRRKIRKGLKCLKIYGYRTSGQVHKRCPEPDNS